MGALTSSSPLRGAAPTIIEVPYTILSHTADTGIAAVGPTIGELLKELATGMFGLMATVADSPPHRSIEVAVRSATVEDLIVDTLSELLFRSEVDDLVFTHFDIDATETSALVVARGVDVRAAEPAGPPIKAVTYHDLAVGRCGGEWEATVYFDV